MSTDVYMYVVRKENHQPMGRYYLGGNGTKSAMYDLFQKATEAERIPGWASLDLIDVQGAKNILEKYSKDFYSDNSADVLLEDFINKQSNYQFSYWLIFEY